MSSESLLMQSIIITCLGMGIVFFFLIVLIGAVKALGCLVQAMEKYFPQAVPQKVSAAGTDNALVAVAIAAAKRFQGK